MNQRQWNRVLEKLSLSRISAKEFPLHTDRMAWGSDSNHRDHTIVWMCCDQRRRSGTHAAEKKRKAQRKWLVSPWDKTSRRGCVCRGIRGVMTLLSWVRRPFPFSPGRDRGSNARASWGVAGGVWRRGQGHKAPTFFLTPFSTAYCSCICTLSLQRLPLLLAYLD